MSLNIDRRLSHSAEQKEERLSIWTLQLPTNDLMSKTSLSYFSYIHQTWATFSAKHQCEVLNALRATPIVNEMIDTGIFIEFRRKVRKYTMISPKHPYTSRVFKSMTEIREEEVRHLVKYHWKIHPFSVASMHYSYFISLVYIYSMVYIIPMNWAFVRYYVPFKWHTFCVDMIITMDIVLNFFTGFFDINKVFVHMHSDKITRHYLRSYFIPDVLSCLTSYMIYLMLLKTGPTYFNLIKWTMIFRLFRIRTVDQNLEIFRLCHEWSSAVHLCAQIVLRTYFTVLICLAGILFIKQLSSVSEFVTISDDYKAAKQALFDTISAMFGVGKLSEFPTRQDAFGYAVCSILAMFLHYWIISQLYTLWQRIQVNQETGDDYVQQLDSYLKYKGLPASLRDAIHCYFDFKFQKHFYKESTVLRMMSVNLRKEVPNHKLSNKFEKIYFMRVLPLNISLAIVANMKSLYFSAGDVVFKIDSENKSLLYLKFGTIALFDKNNVEVCHLEDGSYYGDMSVVIPQKRYVTMIAISPCEVHKLHHKILFEILDVFPALKEQVLEVTRQLLLTKRPDWVAKHITPITQSMPEKPRWSVVV